MKVNGETWSQCCMQSQNGEGFRWLPTICSQTAYLKMEQERNRKKHGIYMPFKLVSIPARYSMWPSGWLHSGDFQMPVVLHSILFRNLCYTSHNEVRGGGVYWNQVVCVSVCHTFVWKISSEPLNCMQPNLVWWCIIMTQFVMQKGWVPIFKDKVTVQAQILKIPK